LVAIVVAAALALFSVALFAPAWVGLSSAEPSAEPGPQLPPVVVVEPSPSSSEDDGLVDGGLASTPPSVAPSGTGEAPAAVAESVDEPTILAEVPVGSTPGFAATPPPGAAAGQQLYVANRAAGVLTVVDTARNAVRGTIPIDDGPPQYLAFSRDGTRAYVSVFSERNNAVNRVVVVDTIRGGVVASIPVGTRPYALAVTPDAAGSEVWVPNHDAASVSIIDTATNTVTKTVSVAANPHWVAFSPDGRFAYTANHESNLITVLEVATKKVVGEVRVGKSPHSVAASPTEPLVANVNYDGHSVSVIDTRTNKVVSTIEHVGSHPQALAWAPDGRHFYTANVDDGTVSVVNAESMTVTARIPTGRARPASRSTRPATTPT
jgi:YVTN family beta-propeller protein